MSIMKAKRLPRKDKKSLMKRNPFLYMTWKGRAAITNMLEFKNKRILTSLFDKT